MRLGCEGVLPAGEYSYTWVMATRAEDVPDPVLVVIDDGPPAMTLDEWLALTVQR